MTQTSPWTAIRKQLVTLDTDMLVRVVKDLHDASPANRDFLAARFLTDEAPSGTRPPIESFRRRIRAVFNIGWGYGDFVSDIVDELSAAV
jgi:hypothetical protein